MRKDVKEARQAYLTISAMANYNDAVNMYLNALKHAQTQLNSFAAGFLGVFSVKSLPPEFDPTTTQVMNTCLSFILVVRIGFLAGPVVSKMGSIPGHFLNGVNIFMQAK